MSSASSSSVFSDGAFANGAAPAYRFVGGSRRGVQRRCNWALVRRNSISDFVASIAMAVSAAAAAITAGIAAYVAFHSG
jgi:hypothetical protein